MEYYRLSIGLNNNTMKPITDNPYDGLDMSKDAYTSLYLYNDSHYERWKQTKSFSGMSGVTTTKMFWDFDCEEDVEKARQDTLTLVNRLLEKNIPENAIQTAFSGHKGFSVQVRTEERFTPEELKIICSRFAKGLETFDNKCYDAQRIIRLVGTRHPKSGLYKALYSVEELKKFDANTIKGMAKYGSNSSGRWETVSLPADVYAMRIEEKKKSIKSEYQIDLKSKPSHWRNCKWSIYQGNFKPGERHQALLVLAATLKGLGYNRNQAYYGCKSALKAQAFLYNQDEFPKEELYKNVIESVYKDDWEGGTYSCQKEGWLKTYCQCLGDQSCKPGDEDDKPITLVEITESFKEYVRNIDKNTVKTGLPSIDDNVFISTGSNLGILGAAGSGKSSVALNILNNTSKQGVKSVFASLDMHRNRMYEKVMYKISGLKREELYDAFKNDKEAYLIEKLKQEFGNVNFFHKSSPSVKDVRDYIHVCQDVSGEKVKLVMLDYFERVSSDYSDDTQASKRVAGELQDLVNDLDIALITLVQPNKIGISGGPDSPLYSYANIKGSSFVYQSFRQIISIWRPFYTPKDFSKDKYMQMAVLKNDLGELTELAFAWDGPKGEIKELEDWQASELESWLKQKQENVEDKAPGW